MKTLISTLKVAIFLFMLAIIFQWLSIEFGPMPPTKSVSTSQPHFLVSDYSTVDRSEFRCPANPKIIFQEPKHGIKYACGNAEFVNYGNSITLLRESDIAEWKLYGQLYFPAHLWHTDRREFYKHLKLYQANPERYDYFDYAEERWQQIQSQQ